MWKDSETMSGLSGGECGDHLVMFAMDTREEG